MVPCHRRSAHPFYLNFLFPCAITGDLPNAEKEFLRALWFQPGDADLLCNLGHVLARTQRYEAALARFQSSIQARESSEAYLGISAVMLCLGQDKEGQRMW